MINKSRKDRLQRQKDNNRKWSSIYAPIQSKLDGYRKNLKRDATSAEKHFKKKLDSYDIRFKFQKYFYNETFQCIIDFFIKTGNVKICVEIDGGYHSTDRQARKDEYRSDWLRKQRDCKIIRFDNEEVFENIDNCLYLLAVLFLSHCNLPQSRNHIAFTQIKNNYVNKNRPELNNSILS